MNGELSVIELNNIAEETAVVDIDAFSADGANAGSQTTEVPSLGTRHSIVNQVGETGFLAQNSVGSANVHSQVGSISAVSIFYKLDDKGSLEYAYAAPFAASPGLVQVSEYNSFLDNENNAEFFNTSEQQARIQLVANDSNNVPVLAIEFVLEPGSSQRIPLGLPKDTYGTLTMQSDIEGVVFRNYVSRDDYVLAFGGQ